MLSFTTTLIHREISYTFSLFCEYLQSCRHKLAFDEVPITHPRGLNGFIPRFPIINGPLEASP